MATLLARLGRAAYRSRRLVAAIWAAVLAGVVALLVTAGGQFDDTFTIPGSESQAALDRLGELQPEAAGASAQIVFAVPEGASVVEPRYQAAIAEVVAEAARAPQVAAVADPFTSQAITPDGRAALATVEYEVQREAVDAGSLEAL
jgi:putative drug exporter of the RND superfamily